MVYKFLLLIALHILAFKFVEGKRFYITPHGACTDCSFRTNNYQWCSLGTRSHDWDYCSTRPGFSSKDYKCKKDHKCGYHGESYFWCYLEQGGWDYCSHIEDTSLQQFTYTGQECHNYCDLGSYVCRKGDYNSEDCSIVNEVTSDGAGCKKESGNSKSFCGYHGYSYQWCYKSSSWGYCSNSYTDFSTKRKRQAETSCSGVVLLERTNELYEDGSRLVTRIYRYEHDPNQIRQASTTQRNDAHTVIYDWHRGINSGGPRWSSTTENSYEQIRLDDQGTIYINGVPFINYQLQINGRNPPSPSTVAHVNIQRDFVGYDRFQRGHRSMIVRGLHYSLNTGGSVLIYQEFFDRYGNSQCPRRN